MNIYTIQISNKQVEVGVPQEIAASWHPQTPWDPEPHLEQLVLLGLPAPDVLVEGDGHALWVCPAMHTHTQLGELVADGAVQRGEVLGDGSLTACLRCSPERCLLDLGHNVVSLEGFSNVFILVGLNTQTTLSTPALVILS